jgi:hypothetical protein
MFRRQLLPGLNFLVSLPGVVDGYKIPVAFRQFSQTGFQASQRLLVKVGIIGLWRRHLFLAERIEPRFFCGFQPDPSGHSIKKRNRA